jgi:transposase
MTPGDWCGRAKTAPPRPCTGSSTISPPDRARDLTHVSADGAEWIHTVVTERALEAVLCLDAFPVVAWTTKDLDAPPVTGRPAAPYRTRRPGHHDQENPVGTAEKPTRAHRGAAHHPGRHRQGQRRTVSGLPAHRTTPHDLPGRELPEARALPAGWISWAGRCRIPAFTRLAKTITRYRDLILNAVEHRLSNARSEATNTHLRLLTRRAYGYHSPDSLITMDDLTRGGLCPPLPGRS